MALTSPVLRSLGTEAALLALAQAPITSIAVTETLEAAGIEATQETIAAVAQAASNERDSLTADLISLQETSGPAEAALRAQAR